MQIKKTKIKSIVFEKDGFIIGRTSSGMTVKGNVHHDPNELVGIEIEFTGEEVANKKYGGTDFVFQQYHMKMDFSTFFLNKIVKVPLSVAKAVIKAFGKDLEEIIEQNPEKLLTIKGIGPKKKIKIVELYAKNKAIHGLAEFLLPFDISTSRIQKIHAFFTSINKSAIAEIKKNPYLLTRMDRIGFKRADEIAIKIGHKLDSPFRIQQGIAHSAKEHIENGHTFVTKDKLFKLSYDILFVGDEEDPSNIDFELNLNMFVSELAILLEKKDQIDMVTEGIYSPPWVIRAEKNIYNTIKKYSQYSQGDILSSEALEQYITNAENENNFKFGDRQKDAIRLSNERRSIFFVYGLAGSGKTTVAKDALSLYIQRVPRDKIVVTSLSGVAANRAKTVTGFRGFTLHSLLGIQGDGTWLFNEKNKLSYEVIMLDECSMVDSVLFSALISAIDFTKTTLMLVGDPAQLQSIGAGDMYRNIIDSGVCPGVGLNQVFRQNQDQVINIFATQYVRAGKRLEHYKTPYEDFSFIDVSIENSWEIKKTVSEKQWAEIRQANNEKILAQITGAAHHHKGDVVQALNSKDIKGYIGAFQAISPQRAGTVGVENLNRVLQNIFNPKTTGRVISTADDSFKRFDKVIHLKNDNRKVCTKEEYVAHKKNIINFIENKEDTTRVFNGQIGMLLEVTRDDEDDDFALVYYPNEEYIAVYEKADFNKKTISLAYAMSIHKSQGSEFSTVVFPVTNSHYNMLNNQLFYTAFTRAKKKLYVIGEDYSLQRGCTNVADTQRDTILSLYFNAGKGKRGIEPSAEVESGVGLFALPNNQGIKA